MTKLDLHCDLAYLEFAFECIIKAHVKFIIQETMNTLYSHFKQSRVRCRFVENNKGTYDLHIWSKLCVNYDFVSFIREYCGLDKLMNKYYDNVDNYSNANYGFLDGNKEYTKQYIFYDFTEEEISSLIAFFNISQYSDINYKEVIHDLANHTINYNFNKLFLSAMNWENDLEKCTILQQNPYNMVVYVNNNINAQQAWYYLINRCPELKFHMSYILSTEQTNDILWAHDYSWFFTLDLNEKEYLGLCHILLRAKEIYNV